MSELAIRDTGGAGRGSKLLDQWGRELVTLAEGGKLDPVIGRETEVERTMQILLRRTKNNPVLIGEPGVGKTAVVEGLAQRIAAGDVPELLKGKLIYSLDLAAMVAGTKYRGEFEERVRKVIQEVGQRSDIILFIDELHALVGAGKSEGALDAGSILKPALARGELSVIGATTLDEYRKYLEKDAALERRFQPVEVGEPSVAQTFEILKGLAEAYGRHHNVVYPDPTLFAAAEWARRHISDRFLPDKAIDLIDEAGAAARIRRVVRGTDAGAATTITVEDIAGVLFRWTGIEVRQITDSDSTRLLAAGDTLKQRVKGQPGPVDGVVRALKRARANFRDPKRPQGVFMFIGPSGVGKTELAKALAEFLFHDEDAMVWIDMSEYMEKHSVSRLVGAPPGYIGYDEGGQLTEAVRRKPYAVVLLDEIEKAHPDVFNILLQVMEDGRLTDSTGRTVDFRDTILIMTSNVGAAYSRHPLGFAPGADLATANEQDARRIDAELQRVFRPEFLNRVDEVMYFGRLSIEDSREIMRDKIDEFAHWVNQSMPRNQRGAPVELKVSANALDYIFKRGYDIDFGPRNLKRTVGRLLGDALVEYKLSGRIRPGDTLRIHLGKTPEGQPTLVATRSRKLAERSVA